MTNAPTIRSAFLSAAPSSKCIPKRAVTFSKFDAPGKSKRYALDDAVQSTDNRRRYQRRGSKTPAMLLLSGADLSIIQGQLPSLKCDCYNFVTCEDCLVHSLLTQRRMTNMHVESEFSNKPRCSPAATTSLECRSRPQRRMSVMTALKYSLESSLTLETPAASVVNTIRRMSMDASRSYALELLSQS